ncbi:TonB-dependent siderophore receptor [Methylorubrum extorquens]
MLTLRRPHQTSPTKEARRREWGLDMSVVRRNIYSALVNASSLVAGAGVLVCGSQPAFAQARYDFTVPRGDLATVVTQIGRTAGTIIVIPQSLAAGRMAGPVQGRETVFDALAKALAGTGLRADSGQGRSIIIRAASSTSAIPPAGANVIEAIDVTDNSGVNAFGDRGFQAGAAGETVRIGGAPIKEIPLSVSVVTRDVVRSQGITSTADAVRNVAGVSASAVSTGRPEFTIRGFKQAGYAINGQIGSTFAQVPIDGVERIEVLKGPTSILTGVSREGGVVNVTLKEPTAEPIRTLTMRYGTYNYKTLAADIGGPVEGVDGLNYRFVASGNHADENYGGYRDPRELHIAPSVRWTGADLSILLGMRYDRAHLVPAPITFAPFLLEGSLGRPLRLPREVPIGSPYFGGSTEEIAFNTRQSYDVGNVLGADVTVNNSTQYLISRAKLLTGLLDATEDEVQGLFNSPSNVSMRDLTNRLDVTTEYNAGFARNFLKLGYDYIDRTNRPRIGGGGGGGGGGGASRECQHSHGPALLSSTICVQSQFARGFINNSRNLLYQ